ncbi:unnamed protein product [Dibothriocephalus latus]|uniref:Fibronectin type-III domain-containing protein n=1 Tax=Dibothriocephalus latus TaxID=60516 RepID=A0A3P7LS82_DIBLA|nr:unnamed protein product [Dibothriocephalus latus]
MLVTWNGSSEDTNNTAFTYIVEAKLAVPNFHVVGVCTSKGTLVCRTLHLDPNTTYIVTVRACTEMDHCSAPSTPIQATTLPSRPLGLTVGIATSTSIQAVVEPTVGDRGMNYQYVIIAESADSTQSCIAVDTSTAQPSCQLSDLQPNAPYNLTAQACTLELFCSLPTEPTSAHTLPNVPEQISVTNVTATTATVYWLPMPTIADDDHNDTYNYVVTYSAGRVPSDEEGISTSSLTLKDTPSYHLQNLQPNMHYAITIKRCTTAGRCSHPSGAVLAITLPDAPQQVFISEVTADSARISWDAPAHGGSVNLSYIVRVVGTNDDEGEVQTCSPSAEDSALSCVVDNLRPGQDYATAVTACAEPGRCSLPIAKEPLHTLPASPSQVQALNVTAQSLLVSWQVNHSSDLHRCTATAHPANGDGAELTCSQQFSPRDNSTEHFLCTINGLQSDTAYNLTVVVCTSADICSQPSQAISTTTLPQSECVCVPFVP